MKIERFVCDRCASEMPAGHEADRVEFFATERGGSIPYTSSLTRYRSTHLCEACWSALAGFFGSAWPDFRLGGSRGIRLGVAETAAAVERPEDGVLISAAAIGALIKHHPTADPDDFALYGAEAQLARCWTLVATVMGEAIARYSTDMFSAEGTSVDSRSAAFARELLNGVRRDLAQALSDGG